MTTPFRPSAESMWEKRKAIRLLQLMDVCESYAERSEQDLPPLLQQALVRRYRSVIGVDPEQRHEFRQALQRLEQTGLVTVTELQEHFHTSIHQTSCGPAEAPEMIR